MYRWYMATSLFQLCLILQPIQNRVLLINTNNFTDSSFLIQGTQVGLSWEVLEFDGKSWLVLDATGNLAKYFGFSL